jgi:hypothetical protein
MKEVMGFLARDTLVKATTSFRSRIEAVFTADGSFIEYVDCQCVSLLIFFTLIFSCAVPFKRKKKKLPDLSLPPCMSLNAVFDRSRTTRYLMLLRCQLENNLFQCRKITGF